MELTFAFRSNPGKVAMHRNIQNLISKISKLKQNYAMSNKKKQVRKIEIYMYLKICITETIQL